MTLITTILCFTACGKNENSDIPDPTPDTNQSSSFEEKTSYDIDLSKQHTSADKMTAAPNIKYETIYSNDKYEIATKNISCGNQKITISMEFKNKTNEEIKYASVAWLSVNDWMIPYPEGYISNVAPNSTATLDVGIFLSEMAFRKITEANKISIVFNIDDERTEIITIETDAINQNNDYAPEGEIIYEKNGVKFILPKDENASGNNIFVYVENNSDKAIYIYGSAKADDYYEPFSSDARGIVFPHSKQTLVIDMKNYIPKAGDEYKGKVQFEEYSLSEGDDVIGTLEMREFTFNIVAERDKIF